MRVLAVTVGGTLAPVITSVTGHKPDHAIFFVTDRPEGGSRRFLPGIVEETGLAQEAYRPVVLEHYDDFASSYRTIRNALREAQAQHPEAECIADYTGGTKTMTVALAAAAMRLGWNLSLVAALRPDLNRAHLTGAPALQSTVPLLLDEVKEHVRLLFQSRDYEGARDLLTDTMRGVVLEPGPRSALTRAVNLLEGLAAWDRFDYSGAYAHLRACGELCKEVLPYLARLDEFASSEDCPPYELVWDLVANADARATQGRYEDGILRLYRAIELIAQVRLKTKHGIATGDLDLEKIPEPLRSEFARKKEQGRGKSTAGLVDSYRILAVRGDPLGRLYEDCWETKLPDLLTLRNRAFMTHGFKPLGREKWEEAQDLAREFLREAADAIKIRLAVPQPPQWSWIEGLIGP